MTGAQLPYAAKFSDYSIVDPGDAGFIDAGQLGEAICRLHTAGSETRTLRAPDHEGDELMLVMAVDAGDCVVTVKDSAGSTSDTLTFANVGDIAVLKAVRTGAGTGTYQWVNQAGSGSVSASSATFTTLTVNTTATLASAILQFTGATGTSEIEVATNLADALSLKIASGADIFTIDTTTSKIRSAFTGALTVTPTQTIASGASITYKGVSVPATTLTLSGSTNVTTATGLNLIEVAAPTYTASMALTVTNAATLYVGGAPAGADMATLTNAYSLWVDGGVSRFDGNLDLAAGAIDIVIPANTAVALEVSDGTNKVLAFDTRNTVKDVANVKVNPVAPTVATAAEVQLNPSLQIAAKTLTYTGTNTVTSSYGAGMHIGIPTFTSAAAGTISAVSNLHVAAVAAAGGSLSLTASYMISTGVSDCFLTNAGVWTDTSCFADGKLGIGTATKDAIAGVLEKLLPKSWTYRSAVHGNDFGRERLGVVYDDLPGELRAPGQEKAVSAGVIGSFALAAIKMLYEQNKALEARLAALGG